MIRTNSIEPDFNSWEQTMNAHLSNMSLNDLTRFIAEAECALAKKRNAQHQHVMEEIRHLADSINVKVSFRDSEKPHNKLKGFKVAPKYRNPENPNQTWTGRGYRPLWMVALIDAGHRLEEFRI